MGHTHQKIDLWWWQTTNRRVTYWFGTCGKRGWNELFIRELWIHIPPPKFRIRQRKVSLLRSKEKHNYLDSCIQKHCHFPPFVVSSDGLIVPGMEANIKHLDIRLAAKWRKPYPQICGYVHSRVTITMVRVTHLCIWGSQVTVIRIRV